MKKTRFFILALFCLCFLAGTGGAWAVTVESDSNLHRVMGNLYALSVAAELYQAETNAVSLPEISRFERYFQKDTLPEGWSWTSSVRTQSVAGDWWVGVEVPSSLETRKFLRLNAPELGIFEADGKNAWLGGKYAWMRAVDFEKNKQTPVFLRFSVQEGYGKDRERLFFNAPGTDTYWWSPLDLSASARGAILKKRGRSGAPNPDLTVALEAPKASDTFKASPVGLPPKLTVEKEEGDDMSLEMGNVRVRPIPRVRSE